MENRSRISHLRQHHGSQPRHAHDGLPAGGGYAAVGIKAHALEQCEQYVHLHPLAVQAGEDCFAIAKRLGARLNEKLVVIASSVSLSKDVVELLGLERNMNQRSATCLGTDYADYVLRSLGATDGASLGSGLTGRARCTALEPDQQLLIEWRSMVLQMRSCTDYGVTAGDSSNHAMAGSPPLRRWR
eukprot:5373913-Pyramimonas_sp.AAC.1